MVENEGFSEQESKGLWKIKNAKDQLESGAWALKDQLTDSETNTVNEMVNGLSYLFNCLKERSKK